MQVQGDETLIIAEAKLYKFIDQKVLYRLQQIHHEMNTVVFKRLSIRGSPCLSF